MSYRDKGGKGDIGLPKQALRLLELSVLETLLCWLQQQSDVAGALETNRQSLIRFALYSAVSVQDPHKASVRMFEVLKAEISASFPEEELIQTLIDEQLALPMYPPESFRTHPVLQNMVATPTTITGLRGWRRFSFADLAPAGAAYTEEERKTVDQAIGLYRRFWNRKQRWNYRHELLLWLQRDYVSRDFETSPALPGAEDETPYDYDHICPQSHWSGWTGVSGCNRIIDFLEFPNEKGDQPQSWLGDSIGNVRVWDSGDNRSDSDASPAIKLGIDGDVIGPDASNCLRDSAIDSIPAMIGDWCACSRSLDAPEQAENPSHWTRERTLAFQRTIENRVFDLYRRFYQDLEPWPESSKAVLRKANEPA